jgi:hypothetical protein
MVTDHVADELCEPTHVDNGFGQLVLERKGKQAVSEQ